MVEFGISKVNKYVTYLEGYFECSGEGSGLFSAETERTFLVYDQTFGLVAGHSSIKSQSFRVCILGDFECHVSVVTRPAG